MREDSHLTVLDSIGFTTKLKINMNHLVEGRGTCELLAGAQGTLAQLALLFVAATCLALKRHYERPKRSARIWLMDVSKQAFSAGVAHLSGMVWAMIISSQTGLKGSQCAWYLVVFFVDTTIGVAVALAFHKSVVRLACDRARTGKCDASDDDSTIVAVLKVTTESVSRCGEYGDPPSALIWLPQMIEWTLCTLAGRIFSGGLVAVGAPLFAAVASAIDTLFTNDVVELWTVMVLGPLSMNLVQVLVQDAVLKWNSRRAESSNCSDGPGSDMEDFASPYSRLLGA